MRGTVVGHVQVHEEGSVAALLLPGERSTGSCPGVVLLRASIGMSICCGRLRFSAERWVGSAGPPGLRLVGQVGGGR
eukprot:15829403-Heterocapsa_arctica.AAC.1